MKQPVMTKSSAKNFRFAADLSLTGIMGGLHPQGTTWRPSWIWFQTVPECRSTETGAGLKVTLLLQRLVQTEHKLDFLVCL